MHALYVKLMRFYMNMIRCYAKIVRFSYANLGAALRNYVLLYKMPGRMGHEKVTVQNLEVVTVDASKNLLLIRGSIPGANGGLVTVNKSVKGAS